METWVQHTEPTVFWPPQWQVPIQDIGHSWQFLHSVSTRISPMSTCSLNVTAIPSEGEHQVGGGTETTNSQNGVESISFPIQKGCGFLDGSKDCHSAYNCKRAAQRGRKSKLEPESLCFDRQHGKCLSKHSKPSREGQKLQRGEGIAKYTQYIPQDKSQLCHKASLRFKKTEIIPNIF